ncbi:hypothetical protein JTE90_011677 [Oedothorax gibbosus]|uniref:K Homology domain-containing protein n=1 Tax=Oedothorax gibbosus TaxID=931172 RepID=A0AAV6UU18_9ARAC|nr:hypothetical protein JTE90_011677 [Oedothorax gibbosus]
MASHDANKNDYINQLIEEKKKLNPQHSHAHKLLQQEIDRVRSNAPGNDSKNDSHVVVHKGKQIRLKVKVHIPVEENPSFNFVGKLLGPKGSSLQQLQEATQTRMAILGKGSMRDKRKEDEMRSNGDPKYTHLNEELHVEVSAFAPAAEAYRRISLAFAELQRFLVPDVAGPYQDQDYYDDPRQPPQYMNDGKKPPYAGDGHPQRALPPRPMGPPLMQGREPPPPRRAQSSYPAAEVDDWAPAPPRSAPRRGGYSGGAPPPARQPPARAYEEPASDYNNYGDGYGDGYNSGNSAGYYDYPADPEPAYADGYGDERSVPMRNSGGAPRGRSNARVATHPYAGATRRGY